jgi:hypothetical protein
MPPIHGDTPGQSVFQPLYIATQQWFRGFVFLLTGSISICSIGLLVFMYVLERRDHRNTHTDDVAEYTPILNDAMLDE